MSWGYNTKRKCIKCGFEYYIEESTLTDLIEGYDDCPKCGSKSKVISQVSVNNEINKKIEIIKNRKKPYHFSTL